MILQVQGNNHVYTRRSLCTARPSQPKNKGIILHGEVLNNCIRPVRPRMSQTPALAGATDSTTRVIDTGFPRTAVVGILGGGQLGKMLAQEAQKMGVAVRVLDPTPACPASTVAAHVLGSFRDPNAIADFAKGCDVLTVEIEHVDVDALEAAAEQSGVDVQPTPTTIRIIQDKHAQKIHFKAAGVPVPEFRDIKCSKCAATAGNLYGYPFMLKAKRLAYDGRGNAVVSSPEMLDEAVVSLGGYENGLYAEKMVPFVCELAVMVARGRDGALASYPVVQTIHKDNICHTTETPAMVPPSAMKTAKLVAESAIACLPGAGVFGVELFLLPDGSILLNEVAPRPHNSGHYTIEGCATSQYEAHLRAVLGWPLGDTSLKVGAALMLNVLGEGAGDEGMAAAHALMGRAYATPGAAVHWYGKAEVAPQRKIGHITLIGKNNYEIRQKLRRIDAAAADAVEKSSIKVTSELQVSGAAKAGPLVGIIMGSDSDLPTMKAAAQVLEDFGVECEVTIVSAHRTPERMFEYATSAHSRGLKAIIAGAGGAAHLPGMVAAMTPLPVIGVPVKPAGSHLDGVDALLSIVQMPRGVPVATVGIGNATNAGLLASRIVASSDDELLQKMLDYQMNMKTTVLGKAEKLEERGWKEY